MSQIPLAFVKGVVGIPYAGLSAVSSAASVTNTASIVTGSASSVLKGSADLANIPFKASFKALKLKGGEQQQKPKRKPSTKK